MTTTLIPPPPTIAPAGLDAASPAPVRDAPGLFVLALPARQIPLAGYLLRHGPALTVVEHLPDPMPVTVAPVGVWALPSDSARIEEARTHAAERALEATMNAGFDVHAVETLPHGRLRPRLRAVRGLDVACIVVAGRGARAVRRLARMAGAPVLILPADAAPAGGPAILAAEDVGRTAPAAARALATEDAVVVAGSPLVSSGALARTAAHPALIPRLDEIAHRMRRDELDAAGMRAQHASVVAREHGLRALPVVSVEEDALTRAAAAREGILVLSDAGGRRVPRLLRSALRERRPVLLVPGPESRQAT